MSSTINILDAIDKMSVMELAALIKSIEEKYGVSAAPVAMAGAAPAAAAEAAEEKTEYKVTLKDAGAEKIKVIKALRTITTLSLGDAKAAVDATPYVVSEAASKDDAAKFKKTLEEAGAKVELS